MLQGQKMLPEQIRAASLRLRLMILLCLLSHLAPASLDAQHISSVRFDDSDMALDLAEALTFRKYPTYEQYLEIMQGFAASYPEICMLDTFGHSQEGRLLLALKISDQVEEEEAEAAFLYSSSMHGDEVLGYVLLLRLADTLLSGYGVDSEISTLVDHLAIWINPLANPDGSFHNDNGLSLRNAVRTARDGTDLNRDFPRPDLGQEDDTTGRALENRFMMEFLRKQRFSMSANLHGGEEVVNYPWDFTPWLHADDAWYRFVSREYADEAMAVDPDYMWGWPDDGITNGWAWYEALGTRQDYVNWYLGGREVTLELSMEKLLPSDQLEQHWNINRRSLINYMSQCLYGIRGTVTDQENAGPVRARIQIENHDSLYSVVHSSETFGDFYRLIKEGVYELIISAPGYFNDTLTSVSVTDYQATELDIQLQPYGLSAQPPGLSSFRIYPNPSSGVLYVEGSTMPAGDVLISLYTLDGRQVYKESHSFFGERIEISTEFLDPGIYMIRCTLGTFSGTYRVLIL